MSRPATVRLLTVWVVVALALPAWAALTAARAPEISVDSGAAPLMIQRKVEMSNFLGS